MAISLKHKFTSPKADGPDTTKIRPSNWNDEHDLTMATQRLLGRASADPGSVEELSLGASLTFNGSNVEVSASVLADIAALVAQKYGLRLRDVNDTHDIIISAGSDLTANRQVIILTGDEDRTLDLTAGSGGDSGLIGDIRYTYADPGLEYLPYDGRIYLKSAYPALSAVIPPPVWATSQAPSKITNPSTLPTGQVNGVAWSPSGRYTALAHNATPYVTIYDWDTGVPVKIANPATLPTSHCKNVAWSPDSRYLAFVHNTAPKVTVYDWDTGSPVKIADPATPVGGTSTDAVAWSNDGRYMVVGFNAPPYIHIYDWDTGVPVKIADPASPPSAAVADIAWSPDDRYMAVAIQGAPVVEIYDWDTGVPVKMSNPAVSPTAIGYSVSFHPSTPYLSVGASSSSKTYDYSSGTFVSITPVHGNTGQVYATKYSKDGHHVASAYQPANYMTLYAQTANGFSDITVPGTLPTGPCHDVDWSPNQKYVAVGMATSPYVHFYTGYVNLGYDPDIEFKLMFEANKWVRKS